MSKLDTFVILVPGHGARVHANWDPGAVSGDIVEADEVRQLCSLLQTEMTKLSIQGGVFDAAKNAKSDDRLRQYGGRILAGLQAAKAAKATKALVVHTHFNAGGGQHSLAFCAPSSPSCTKAAGLLTAAMLQWRPALRSRAEDVVTSSGANNLTNATWAESAKFKDIETSCVVLEPWFVDAPNAGVEFTPDRQALLARWLAAALSEWALTN